MYVGKNVITDVPGKPDNYIFSTRLITKPEAKFFGESEYKQQIIEREGRIYTVWDRTFKNHYILWLCYKTEKLNFKLKCLKNIK